MNSSTIIKRHCFHFTSIFLMLFLFSAAQSTIAAEPLHNEAKAKNKSNITKKAPFDAWHLKCITSKNDKERCFIDQHITGQKGKATLASLIVNFNSVSDTPILTFKLPLGISLIPGMLYGIDAGDKFKLPIRVCNKEACVARKELDKKMIAKLYKGREIKVLFYVGNNSKTITLTASLIGFRKALAALITNKETN